MNFSNDSNNQEAANSETGTISNAALFNKIPVTNKPKKCPLSGPDAPIIDYKNVELLRAYLSESNGRILPSRLTGISRSKQRLIRKMVLRARILALLPYC